MRDQFFKLYIDIKVAERYYCRYIKRSVFWSNIITGICLIGSAATIGSWAVWQSIPIVWAVIIALAQALATFRPLLKSSSRLSAAKYLLPDLSKLSDDAACCWDEINLNVINQTENETAIFESITLLRRQLTTIRERYAPSELFPEKDTFKKQAEKDASTYFSVQYNIEMEEPQDE